MPTPTIKKSANGDEKMVPDFKSEPERQKWIIENANYFTIVRLKNRKYIRYETETLAGAHIVASGLVRDNPGTRWMIYAVHDQSDTYVCTVSK